MKRRDSALSAERAELAEAIQAAQAAKRVRDNALAAGEPAQQAVWAARRRVTDATAAIETAKSQAGLQSAAYLASGDLLEAPTGLREAREALIVAEDALAVATATRDALDARKDSDGWAVELSARRLRDAVAAVIRSEADPTPEMLGTEILAMERELGKKAAVLRWLVNNVDALEREQRHGGLYGQPLDADLRRVMWAGSSSADVPAVAALAAAFAQLEHDPMAQVPKIG